MNRRKIPAWMLCRDALAFRAAFLAAALEARDGLVTADEAVTKADRAGRRLGTGRHIGPQVSDLHRRGLTAPVETPDGFRAAVQSARGARRSGLSGVWRVADRAGCAADLARTLHLLEAYPPDPPARRTPPALFDNH